MTIRSGVSFLGQSNTQILRLVDLRAKMDDLQRQITTQKKHDSLTGFGLEARRILQLHADRDMLESYSTNIDKTLTRLQLMTKGLDQTSEAMRQMVDALQLQPEGTGFDITDINIRASQLLDFVIDIANTSFDGRYLFAGTDTQNPPVIDRNAINANFQAEMSDWLDGTNTTAQLLANVSAFSSADLGFSSTIGGAQDVRTRVDKGLEVSYGAIADRSGMQEVIRVLGFLANLRMPDPMTDVPTQAEFDTLARSLQLTGRDAMKDIHSTQIAMTGKLDLLKSLHESHREDINLFQTLIDKEEGADLTEAIASLQAVQTQLTASYEVTQFVNQLSLVNFLR